MQNHHGFELTNMHQHTIHHTHVSFGKNYFNQDFDLYH